MKLPLKTFWMLHKNVDRILAERDLRTAELVVKTQSSEGLEDLLMDLRKQMGSVITYDRSQRARKVEDLDRGGLADLKGFGGMK